MCESLGLGELAALFLTRGVATKGSEKAKLGIGRALKGFGLASSTLTFLCFKSRLGSCRATDGLDLAKFGIGLATKAVTLGALVFSLGGLVMTARSLV